jgi:hypothetical protein
LSKNGDLSGKSLILADLSVHAILQNTVIRGGLIYRT